jgi:hypothetical protein
VNRFSRIAAVVGTSSLLVTLPAVPAAAAPAVRLDMQDCNGDTSAPIDESTWNSSAVTSIAGGVHQVCAALFGDGDVPAPGSVTFSITSGPGSFTDAGGSTSLGNSVTVSPGDTYNVAYIKSTGTGTTTVQVSSGALSASGTKAWAAGAGRTVILGTPSGSSASAARVITATVRDAFANGVPGVSVTFGSSGVGRISSATTVVTDAGGQATATLRRFPGETGTQTVTATISPATTDCERPAADPAGAPAGVCIATASVQWTASASQLTLAADPIFGVWGTEFRIAGVLSAGSDPIPARNVSIFRRLGGGSFQFYRQATTDELGRFLIIDKPSANSQYFAIFGSEEDVSAAQSPIAGIGVRVGVIFNASRSSTPANSVVTFTGRVLPVHPGRSVYLQQFSPSSGWRTIASTRLTSQSTYTFHVVKRTSGFLLFRAAVASDADHAWNVSINRRIDWI